MLRKVQKSCNITAGPEESMPCTICETTSNKTVLYMCESGHIMCGHCRHIDERTEPHDDGDGVKKESFQKPKLLQPSNSLDLNNLACGDHSKNTNKTKRKCKSEHKIGNSSYNLEPIKEVKKNEDIETTIRFKNINFNNSESSGSSFEKLTENDVEELKNIPRPVLCPITECKKMLAMDSVILHFFFDHSKIRKLSKDKTFLQILIKLSDFTYTTRCFAIIKLNSETRFSAENNNTVKKNKPENDSLLLMGTKIIIGSENYVQKSKVVTKNVYIQTDFNNKPKQKCFMDHQPSKNDRNKKNNDVKEENAIILLWLCKLVEDEKIYKITLSREDNKLSYSFTGNAIHIKEHQDGAAMHQKSECLVVRGAAANKVADDQKHMKVLVDVL